MTFDIDYLAIAPELVIVATMVVVFVLDLVLTRPKKYWTATAAVAGTAMAAIPLVFLAVDGEIRSMFEGSFVVDEFALVLKGLFVVAGTLLYNGASRSVPAATMTVFAQTEMVLVPVWGFLVLAERPAPGTLLGARRKALPRALAGVSRAPLRGAVEDEQGTRTSHHSGRSPARPNDARPR